MARRRIVLNAHECAALLAEQRDKLLKRSSSLPEKVLFVAALALFDISAPVEVAEWLRVSERLDVHVLNADFGTWC